MRYIHTCILLLISNSLIFAQTAFDKKYNLSNNKDYGLTLSENFEGGYLLIGTSRFPSNLDASFLINTNCNGDTIWTKQIDASPNIENPWAVQKTTNGYALAGEVYNDTIGVLNYYLVTVTK